MTKLLIISLCFLCPLWLYSLRLCVLVANTPRNLRNLRLIKDLRTCLAPFSLFPSPFSLLRSRMLYNCREDSTTIESSLQINLFMQNKANFRKVKFNVNKVLTRNYDQLDTWSIRKTKPIQSQSNPISEANKMATTFKRKRKVKLANGKTVIKQSHKYYTRSLSE